MKFPRFSDVIQGLGASSSPKPTRYVILHDQYTAGETTGGLSVIFTILCIVDLFGVFPVVALPKSIISCGVYGIPLVLSVFALQLYTAVLLGKCWLLAHEISPSIRDKSRYPYAAVAELAYGGHAKRLVTFLIDSTVFAAGIPNFIFASQSLQLFWWKITGGEVGVTYCVWMLILGLLLCPVMWLGSPKDMKPIALTSVCIVSTVAVSTWVCIWTDDQSPPASGDVLVYMPTFKDFLVAYGIIAFQFDIHPMLLTLQVDMKDSRKINSAVVSGFIITGLLFLVTSLLAANRYGNNVESNILQGMPPSITLYIVALLVTLQLSLSSAVGNTALFQHLEDLLNIPRDFGIKRCLLRSSVIAFAVFLGEAVPRFDVVMGLVGSTLTGPLMFIFPPIFFLRLCYMKSKMVDGNIILRKKKVRFSDSNFNAIDDEDQNYSFGSDALKLPVLKYRMQAKYKTFMDPQYEQIESHDEYSIKWYDVMFALIVTLMGVTATMVATYSSWSEAISSATYSPPCLVNATAAARDFIEAMTMGK